MERTPASQAWRAMRSLLLQGEGHRQLLRACSSSGLTPGMLKMAMQLSPERPQAMRELAERFHCDASYVTSVVDGLEQLGVAQRRPHPSDRRIKTVVLTEHGRGVLAQVDAMLDEPPAALQVLDAAEQEQLRDLLQRVLAAGGTSPAGALTEGTVPTPAAEPVPDAEATVPPARNEAVTPASGPTAPGLR